MFSQAQTLDSDVGIVGARPISTDTADAAIAPGVAVTRHEQDPAELDLGASSTAVRPPVRTGDGSLASREDIDSRCADRGFDEHEEQA
jgi:hypothetical protein